MLVENSNLKSGNMLKFTDLMPGILGRLPRIPPLFKVVRDMQKTSLEDNNSMGLLIEKNATLFPDKKALLYEDPKLDAFIDWENKQNILAWLDSL